jgi:hypothetical protein
LQRLTERSNPSLKFHIVCSRTQEDADTPHLLALLRPRRERPWRHRTAEKRDELASSH